ncbi:MAG: riboflavin synthase [Gemmatimonadetes bacterium]|nr:riboflavin synthase [Gemmatimonadota bacterium]
MFTGLVESQAPLGPIAPFGSGLRLRVADPGWSEGLETGASVAVDGCCLTVTGREGGFFSLDVTRATLGRTRFGSLHEGALVNLERPLAVGARLGGHWVQGHVDGLLRVTQIERAGETCYVDLSLPLEAGEWVVPQGSIALNGVSLTVLDRVSDALRVAIIPHTWSSTNLSAVVPGDTLHVEYDVLAKYVTAAVHRHLGSHVPKL